MCKITKKLTVLQLTHAESTKEHGCVWENKNHMRKN